MAQKPARDRLEGYRRKRSAGRTPEPFSGPSTARPRLFVVQKHAARNMHFDLRLEMEGVLQSWAVPKGPSLDPQDKRLAVLVEEHPLEYAEFEGIIPAGNYGAGAVIVWDRGRWDPIGDPLAGVRDGKLLFDLHGYKLRGRWTLFRTKRKSTEWLLMKKPDPAAEPRPFDERSIRSGLTVEQLRDGYDPAAALRRRLTRLDPPRRRFALESLSPMLGRARDRPFSGGGWLFEIKYDGFRLLAERDGATARLRFRGGGDATAALPEIADALRALPFPSFVVDGEVVVLDEQGKPSFQLLQQRIRLSRGGDATRLTVDRPATLFVFDLLALDDRDLRPLPLVERKRLLEKIVPPLGPLRYCEHIVGRGEEMYRAAQELGLEGVMAKRSAAAYVAGRSDDWLKIRADRTGNFAIVGYSPPKRARGGFAALHVAAYDGSRLVYAGR
ncbi:MAG TPA: DNA polymerase ligase N-terminal domain-containing protein, partial [Candidatus Polarisedimenticolaceae bacterium]|nr:DNA polymerase ligase N-terminal domain-containing protein [Candidatus Polarisedimenticolaceae bacterium]